MASPSPWRAPWKISRAIIRSPLACRFTFTFTFTFTSSSHSSRAFTSASWHTQTTLASSRVQIYTSRSHNPYLNLSAEHFLLQQSHPDSTILFLYTNDPCVVIGRNQNPWLEVNLSLLHQYAARTHDTVADDASSGNSSSTTTTTTKRVALVRRRSGGGTVFHDRGNVNFSVICPPAAFDRDKHAEMVVRALKGLGIATARVNARHDIVVDSDSDSEATYKISGSAYKLTRQRSLHHGTCLLSSPNLRDIGKVLRSPAEPYIKARGVDSVRSKIRNVGVSSEAFTEAVVGEFRAMYGEPDLEVVMVGGEGKDDSLDFAHEQIQKGVEELTSREWIYNQTPQFTFSTHPSEEDPRDRPALPQGVPKDFRATITARHGEIHEAKIAGCDERLLLQGEQLHRITDWRPLLQRGEDSAATQNIGSWFNHLFGGNGDGTKS